MQKNETEAPTSMVTEHPASPRPLFLVFEGMDGTGKTTQMKRLAARLASEGIPSVLTAEPSSSEDGQRLRRALSGKEPASNSRMAALFLLDRIGHNEEIAAYLAEGKTVLSDRYYYSSMAYQGSGDAFDWVSDMNLHCPDIRKPDGCIILDMNPEDSMARIREGRTTDELEIYETVAKQQKVRELFARAMKRVEGRDTVITVDAAGTPDEVAARVWQAYLQIAGQD